MALDDDVAGASAGGGSGGSGGTSPRRPTIRDAGSFPADGGVLRMDGSVGVARDGGITIFRDAAIDVALDAGEDAETEFAASCSDDGGTGVARIALGATDVNGALTTEYIRRVERRNLYSLRSCYEELLERGCVQVLVVELTYRIAPDGSVATALATSFPIGDATIQQCVAAAAGEWTFEPPADAGSVMVAQRLRFALTD